MTNRIDEIRNRTMDSLDKRAKIYPNSDLPQINKDIKYLLEIIQSVYNVASAIAVGWENIDGQRQLAYAQAFMESAKRIFIALDDEETAQHIEKMAVRVAQDHRND